MDTYINIQFSCFDENGNMLKIIGANYHNNIPFLITDKNDEIEAKGLICIGFIPFILGVSFEILETKPYIWKMV